MTITGIRVSDQRTELLAVDGEKIACTVLERPDLRDRPTATTAVVLHGAGTADQSVHRQLAELLAELGCRAVTLDFSGHGASSGRVPELSLERRFEQARAVIEEVGSADGELLLVGASMSGQTVADLARHYGARVAGLGLLAPAVYPRNAWTLPFGAGSGFTEAIRVPQAWQDSAALDAYAAFAGRAVLVVPGEDHVIPPAVTSAIAAALATRATFTRLLYPDATHHLGRYFRADPDACARFAYALTGAATPA
ncbi:hypothetical protein GCM10009665_20320 [Kitasatospora nipponensis]|uniref:Serine aminopeptidase S33 domain-containing protein n=1 Tax=Kitasatospora nipponensis TaxID=258049 RepID=A0ABN1W5P2_9ACTN